MENGDGYIWDNNLDLRDNCNSGWEQQQSNDGRINDNVENSAALINECQHQWRVQPDVLNVNSMKLMRATVECNASSSLLLLYVTAWLSSFSAPLLWQIWHESTKCDVTLRVETDLLWVDADNPWLHWIYWGKRCKVWIAAVADIKKSPQSPLIFLRLTAPLLWQLSCIRFVSSHCTKSREIAMRLTIWPAWCIGGRRRMGRDASFVIVMYHPRQMSQMQFKIFAISFNRRLLKGES